MKYDLIIVGGGAAGLMAAIAAADAFPDAKIRIIEKMEKCGRKIRITGKGRCNLTNNRPYDQFLEHIKGGREQFRYAFEQFDNFYTMDFFENIGLPLVTLQGGRIFPRSEDAWDVVRSLEGACRELGVVISTNCELRAVQKDGEGFLLDTSLGSIQSTRLVIATGGMTYPRTGSTGDGYQFAKHLGHTITPLYPSLLPFEFSSGHLSQLRGLVVKNISIGLEVDSELVDRAEGEIEFFGFGVGGGLIYKLSREASLALTNGKSVAFVVDFKPSLSEAKLLGRIERELAQNPSLSIAEFTRKLFPQKMLEFILEKIALNRKILLSSLQIEQQKEMIAAIKAVRIEVTRSRGFAEAVITAGGVSGGEIDPLTMKSRICDGLLFAGEILDMDADTGGYNLQIAFSTAYVAGRNSLL